MPSEPSSVRVADTVSELLYAVAGWLLVGLGLFAAVGTVGRLLTGATGGTLLAPAVVLLFACLLVLFGVFVNPRFRRRLDDRTAVSQFGRTKRVDRRVLRAEEGRTETCVNCTQPLTEGLVRRYREQVCLAGVPVWTRSEGRNYYCVDCATTELSGGMQSVDSGRQHNESREVEAERQ